MVKEDRQLCCSKSLAFKKRQQGSFSIELAFVMIALMGIFLFTAELSKKLLLRAKLDRSSYALVNILKERSRYYEADFNQGRNINVTSQNLEDMEKLASRMLDIDKKDVAIQVESLAKKRALPVTFSSDKFREFKCAAKPITELGDLIPVEDESPRPIYQVSLCMKQSSWESPFSTDKKSEIVTIASSSMIPGR